MQIENKSDGLINIFAGIALGARSMTPVSPDMEQAVLTSPLIADYEKGGLLVIHKTPVATATAAAAAAPTDKSAK
jgi:hypothetical protein